ncbi:DMT family transporter [Propionibacteriaceae bacterium Y2011]|uniref:DMT family transporter n=1 Tax=Microlunatus sp. Y2014 TaxID=3418488 RepID=UPI003B4F0F8E
MAAGLVAGAVVAAQARLNGELAAQLGDPFLAALISFLVGLVVITAITVGRPSGRRGIRSVAEMVRTGSRPRWFLAGGACGAFLVLTQSVTAAVLGVALFTVSVVAGQTVGGLVIDRIGISTAGPVRLSGQRVLGAVLTLVAVVVSMSGRLSGDAPWWLMAMPVVAGLGVGLQAAVNGQIAAISNVGTATWVNFLVGAVLLTAGFVVHGVVVGWPQQFPSQPWLYVGGLMGLAYMGINVALVRHLGVLVLGMAVIAGQLIGSLLLDLLLPVAGQGVGWPTLAGTALALVAITITTARRRGRAR